MNEALLSLAAAAALVGAPAADAPVPRMLQTVEVARLRLADASARRAPAFLSRRLGEETVEAAAAFDAEAGVWLRLRSGPWTRVVAAPAAGAGLAMNLPGGDALASYARGLRIARDGRTAEYPEHELLEALRQAAPRVQLGPTAFAALYEDGADVPASVCLLRRDSEGNHFVTHRRLDELRRTQWIMAADGVLYGMVLGDGDLIFLSRPVPER